MNTKFCIYCMNPLSQDGSCQVCGHTASDYQSASHHLKPGTVLEKRYLVGRVLGEGGFGITYIGCDLKLKLKVAIKEYYPSDVSTRDTSITSVVTNRTDMRDGSFQRGKIKFLREAQNMAKLDKLKTIVGVKDFFEENNTAYIIMEYIEGTTLKMLVRQKGGKIPPDELFPMIQPLFQALTIMHDNGLIHRDISPDNMMLEQGAIRLLDFGCARESVASERTSTIMLKNGYSPIEQYSTLTENQGPWSDVYALSATIYFCLTGIKPPPATNRLLDDPIKLPSQLGVPITPWQEYVLRKGMHMDWKERYQTMSELQEALYGPEQVPPPITPYIIGGRRTSDRIMDEEEATVAYREPKNTDDQTDVSDVIAENEELYTDHGVSDEGEKLHIDSDASAEEVNLYTASGALVEESRSDERLGDSVEQSVYDTEAEDADETEAYIVDGNIFGESRSSDKNPGVCAESDNFNVDFKNIEEEDDFKTEAIFREERADLKSNLHGSGLEIPQTDNRTSSDVKFIDSEEYVTEKKQKPHEEGKKRFVPVFIGLGGMLAVVIVWFLLNTKTVPNVLELPVDDAVNALNNASFETVEIEYEDSDTIPKGCVMAVSDSGRIRKHSPLKLIVSNGCYKILPDLVGKSFSEADKKVTEMDLVMSVIKEYSDTVDKDQVIKQEPSSGTELEKGSVITITVSQGPLPFALKSYIDMDMTKVSKSIEKLGLQIKTEEVESKKKSIGTVLSQNPEAGEQVQKGDTITFTVSKGALIPNVKEKSESDAKKILKEAGFKVETKMEFHDTVEERLVISQKEKEKKYAEPGSVVHLTISKGAGAKVPDLEGKTRRGAELALEEAGLRLGDVSTRTTTSSSMDDSVASQSSDPGTMISKGSAVSVTMYVYEQPATQEPSRRPSTQTPHWQPSTTRAPETTRQEGTRPGTVIIDGDETKPGTVIIN